jgi:hypothetical protein
MLFVNGVLVGWRSKKQKVVSLSSSEAKFYALAEVVKEIPFIIQVLTFLDVPVETPVTMCVDSIEAIFMSENPNSSSRTHHMSTRYFYVMDLQNHNVIIVKFIGLAKNLADVSTKNVLVKVHEAIVFQRMNSKVPKRERCHRRVCQRFGRTFECGYNAVATWE